MFKRFRSKTVTATEDKHLAPLSMARERGSIIFPKKRILKLYESSPKTYSNRLKRWIYNKRGDMKISYSVDKSTASFRFAERGWPNQRTSLDALTYFLLKMKREGIKKVETITFDSNIELLGRFRFAPSLNALGIAELDIGKMSEDQIKKIKNQPVSQKYLKTLYQTHIDIYSHGFSHFYKMR